MQEKLRRLDELKIMLNSYTKPLVKEIDFDSFVKEANELREIIHEINSLELITFETPLFRGHADSSWKLESTLERKTNNLQIHRYYQNVLSIKSQYESFSDKNWESGINVQQLCTREGLVSTFKEIDDLANDLPYLQFLAHLRHHGYPSPLLDWTKSPYFAAYFAFSNARKSNCCLLYTSPSPRDGLLSRMPSSA